MSLWLVQGFVAVEDMARSDATWRKLKDLDKEPWIAAAEESLPDVVQRMKQLPIELRSFERQVRVCVRVCECVCAHVRVRVRVGACLCVWVPGW
jgi:hypothetical protein